MLRLFLSYGVVTVPLFSVNCTPQSDTERRSKVSVERFGHCAALFKCPHPPLSSVENVYVLNHCEHLFFTIQPYLPLYKCHPDSMTAPVPADRHGLIVPAVPLSVRDVLHGDGTAGPGPPLHHGRRQDVWRNGQTVRLPVAVSGVACAEKWPDGEAGSGGVRGGMCGEMDGQVLQCRCQGWYGQIDSICFSTLPPISRS